MTPAQKEQLQTIVNLFDQAEALIKEIERLNSDLAIPSINQLRYVGYHIARALCEGAATDIIDKEINKAKNHCQRAIYDAHEVGIIYLLQSIKTFKARNTEKSNAVLQALPTYVDDLVAADKAAKFIDQINKNHRDNRSAYYEQAKPHYSTLREIENKLTTAEPLIQTSHQTQVIQDKRITRRFILATGLTLLGITASIVFGVL